MIDDTLLYYYNRFYDYETLFQSDLSTNLVLPKLLINNTKLVERSD